MHCSMFASSSCSLRGAFSLLSCVSSSWTTDWTWPPKSLLLLFVASSSFLCWSSMFLLCFGFCSVWRPLSNVAVKLLTSFLVCNHAFHILHWLLHPNILFCCTFNLTISAKYFSIKMIIRYEAQAKSCTSASDLFLPPLFLQCICSKLLVPVNVHQAQPLNPEWGFTEASSRQVSCYVLAAPLDQSAPTEEVLAIWGMVCVWRQREATVHSKTMMAAPRKVSIDAAIESLPSEMESVSSLKEVQVTPFLNFSLLAHFPKMGYTVTTIPAIN